MKIEIILRVALYITAAALIFATVSHQAFVYLVAYTVLLATAAAWELVTSFYKRKVGDDPRPPTPGALIDRLPDGVKLIALTGRRHQGKSTAAEHLRVHYGATTVHAFNGGKVAAEAYFAYITGSKEYAARMVHSDLKDVASPYLPGYVSPRYFMERFGEFMGVQMGTPWTLEMEITLAVASGAKLIVVESLVYESDVIKRLGGKIIRMERLGYVPPAVDSDATQAEISVDATVTDGSVGVALATLDNWLVVWGVSRKKK